MQGAEPSALDAAPQSGESQKPWGIHGSLTSSYRGRWTDGADDHDLYGLFSLDFGDADQHPWSGHVLGRVAADADGSQDANDPFFNLSDTFSGSIDGRIYEAWGQRRDVGFLEQVRVGRQWIYQTPELAWFDGVSAQTAERGEKRSQLGAYAGIPVRLFESSRSDDQVFGLFGETRPWKGGRLRADWMHLEDESILGAHENDLLGLNVVQSVGGPLRVEGGYTRLENHDRDLTLRATWADVERDLVLQASYYELLRTQKDLALELDPFTNTLFEYFPFRLYRLLASKGLSPKLEVQGGLDVRRVEDDADIGPFNHDFERYFATLNVRDVLPKDTTLAVTGEAWDGDGSDIRGVGFDLSRRFRQDVDASLGTYVSLFKVDVVTGTEREDVRTYYAKARWKRTSSTTWDLRYEFEDTDADPFHTLRAGMTWRF